jgi:hypothetical protein
MKRIMMAILLVPTLSACQTMGSVTDWWGGDSASAKPALTCTAVLTPDAMASSTITKGDAPMDIQATLRLRVDTVDCERTDAGIRQTVQVTISGIKGPALKTDELKTAFFAAVVDPDTNVTAKKMYQTTLEFNDGKAAEQLTLLFNLTADQAVRSSIYLGFRPVAR